MQRKITGLLLLLCSLSSAPGTVMATESSESSMRIVDPKLTRFVQAAVDANPRTQAARAALEASEAFKSAASRPLYNPKLSLDAENSDTDTRAIGLSQTIDWGGKRSARTTVAESNRLAVEAEYLAVRWAVTIELLSGLASHQTGVERDELAAERVRLMNEFAALAKRRFEAGDLNQVELDLATLASTGARMQKATAGAELAEARQAIRNLVVGSAPAQWPTLPTQLPGLPSSAIDTQSLVLTLPEVRAAQRRADAASAAVELRERERRPDPTISLVGGREDDETLVGLNVSIPMYVRNRFSYEVTAAIAQHNQTQQIANDILRRAHSRLIGATERYQLSRDGWRDWERTGRVSVDDQAVQLRRLWEAGEISTTDYLVQLRQTLDVQEGALDLRQILWRAWFEWLAASGRVDQGLGMETNP
jgi:outer membrane protein, heavy metal efflux system